MLPGSCEILEEPFPDGVCLGSGEAMTCLVLLWFCVSFCVLLLLAFIGCVVALRVASLAEGPGLPLPEAWGEIS